MISCPDTAKLQQLLDETLSEAEYRAIEEHVEACPPCKETLDRLTASAGAIWQTPPRSGPATPLVDSSAISSSPPIEAALPNVPGYEVLKELGHGGYGVVYQARQVGVNRLVALKMIKDGAYASPEELARFRREAEAIARLQHPHIVQIHEIGEHDGRPFFSLEFVEGGSLARKLDATPQPARAAAQLLETLARAIHAAHQRGIVHRDLKPANVLLVRSDPIHGVRLGSPAEAGHYEPKITDFGLAKQLDHDAGQTPTGAVMGTPSYMAPEQAGGRSKMVGPAADVYALGAMLYELLTGRPPFKAETTWDTLMQVVAEEPVPPRRLQPKVPRDLETICLKCLEKNPGRRYSSAEALADDLKRWLGSEPILARRTGPVEQLAKWCRRNPAVATAVGAVTFHLVVILVGLVGWAISVKRLNTDLREQRDQAEQSRDQADRASQASARVLSWLTAYIRMDEKVRHLFGLPPALTQRENEDLRITDLLDALDYLAQLSPDSSGGRDHQRQVANISLLVGMMYTTKDRFTQAEPLLRRAVNAWQHLVDRADRDAEARNELAGSYYYLGVVFRETKRLDQTKGAWLKSIEVQERLVERFPNNPGYASNLGRAYYNMGAYASQNEKPDDVVRWQSKAIGTLQPFLKNEQERWFLASAHAARGWGYMDLQKHDFARVDFEQSVSLTDDPASKRERRLSGLAFAHAYCGDHAKAVFEAQKAVGPEPTNGQEMFDLANVLSVSAGAARKDNKIPPAEAARLADQYADQAVQLLRKAHEANYFKDAKARQTLRERPDFAPLRGRPDFRELGNRIEKAAGAGKQQPPVADSPSR
jgi:serine/threonine protein kinase/tetratricopeptide (TPR) repeat protein